MTAISKAAEKWFEKREICPETAVRYGVYTGRTDDSGTVTPDASGNVIVFPFVDHGRVVAEKYRGAHNTSCVIPYRRICQRDWYATTILVEPNRIVVFDYLAACNFPEQPIGFPGEFRRAEDP